MDFRSPQFLNLNHAKKIKEAQECTTVRLCLLLDRLNLMLNLRESFTGSLAPEPLLKSSKL